MDREPLTIKPALIVLALTVYALWWGRKEKNKPDYQENYGDRYYNLYVIGNLVAYLLTGSIWFYLFGGLWLAVAAKMIREG